MHPLTTLVALALCAGVPAAAVAQQEADTLYGPEVGAPWFPAGGGPLVLVDGGHANFHTADGRFLPFARLIARRVRVAPDALAWGAGLVGGFTPATGSCPR
jgi:hypothetical protein